MSCTNSLYCSFLQKFMDAIRARFSMIDVAKHQLELQKDAKNKLLTFTNEVKIITSSDDTFKLWQEVISCAAQGDLIDVDSKELTKSRTTRTLSQKRMECSLGSFSNSLVIYPRQIMQSSVGTSSISQVHLGNSRPRRLS